MLSGAEVEEGVEHSSESIPLKDIASHVQLPCAISMLTNNDAKVAAMMPVYLNLYYIFSIV